MHERHIYSRKYKLGNTCKKYNDAQQKWNPVTLESSKIKSAVYITKIFPFS